MLKKSVAVFLVVILALSTFSGCKQETTDTNEVNKTKQNEKASDGVEEQVLDYALNANPETLDPGLAAENNGIYVIANSFEGLVKVNEDGTVVPAAAERWEVSDDQTEYTFTIREDAKWSDGKPVTARDFEYAWKRAVDPKTASEFAYFFYYLKNGEEVVEGNVNPEELGVKAVDERILKVTLEAPVSYIFNIFAFITYFPVREDIVERNPEKWTLDSKSLVSNGPFKVSNWKQNEEVALMKNDNYWNSDEVKLEEIRFQIIGDASTALAAFESGQIDGSYHVPSTEIPRLTVESEDFYLQPTLSIQYFEFNTKVKPFDDMRVRKAFSLAIDRKLITSRITLGGEKPAVGLVPFGINLGGEDFRENGGSYDIDPDNAKIEEARKLLAEAGYPEGKGLPKIKLNIQSGSGNQRIAEAIMEMWKNNLGITEIELLPQEGKVHYSDLGAGNFQVGLAGWNGDYIHPMTFLDMWITGSGNNSTQYNNEEFDKLIKSAKVALDTKEGLEYMHKAEDIWMNQHVVAPLYYLSQPVLMKKHVMGYKMTSTSMLYLDKAYIEGKEK